MNTFQGCMDKHFRENGIIFHTIAIICDSMGKFYVWKKKGTECNNWDLQVS